MVAQRPMHVQQRTHEYSNATKLAERREKKTVQRKVNLKSKKPNSSIGQNGMHACSDNLP